jgi:hypothetical protein
MKGGISSKSNLKIVLPKRHINIRINQEEQE